MRHTDVTLDEEIQTHLAMIAQDYQRAGLSPEDASAKAQQDFGNVARTREDYREQRGFPTVEAFCQDLMLAFRSLLKRPVLLLTTSLSIAIGAGLNIGIYSVLSQVLFHTSLSGVRADDRLAQINGEVSFPNYADLRNTRAFADAAAFQSATLVWRTSSNTTSVNAKVASTNFFEIANVRAMQGRLFRGEDTQAVVLGFGFWQRRFAGNAKIIGQTMDLNGWPFVIVGVLPNDFNAPLFPFTAADIYVPISSLICDGLSDRAARQFDLLARLPYGLSADRAAEPLSAAARQLARRFPRENARLERSLSVSAVSGLSMWQQMGVGGAMMTASLALFGIVGLILVVTCANVAGLLVSRAEERCREIAICAALGASRWRLIQRVVAESAVIAVLGCVIGAALYGAFTMAAPRLAWSAVNLSVLPPPLPFVYCCVLIVLITVACGSLPSLAVNRMAPAAALATVGPHLSRSAKGVAQKLLVILQVAICFVLLTGSFLLLRSVLDMEHVDPGFDAEHILALSVRRPTGVGGGREPAAQAFGRIRQTIEQVPGVESVSCVRYLPLKFITWRARIRAVASGSSQAADVFPVGPHYFKTMRIPVVRGREWNDGDDSVNHGNLTPVVINRTLARRLAGTSNPIGLRIAIENESGQGAEQLVEVLGVAQDSKVRALNEDPHPVVYLPELNTSFVIRTEGPAETALRAVENAVSKNHPGTAVRATAMRAEVAIARLPTEVGGGLLGFLGALAMFLAMTGLYASITFAVNRRTFEIGIRVALGATRGAITAAVVRESLLTVTIGCAIGLTAALVASKIFSPLLAAGRSANDPFVLLAATASLLFAGVTASLLPALRAARMDPLAALRHD